ncbi:MAG: ABC transporter substrate-binding protein [Alphaproteobacteria bacterium]|nr:ABC transporter substrate-binding protein [Alphaproteobacteria bacterium]
MRKLIWTLVIVTIVAIFGGRAWYLYQHRETSENVVKVGVLSFLTGQYAKMGQDMTNGIILATEEINTSPDYNGTQIQLVIEDGKGIAKDSVNAFNKILFHNVQALIAMGDNQVPPVAPLIIQNKLPTVVTSCYNNEPIKQNKPEKYMYKNSYPLGKFSEWFGEYAAQKLNLKTISILPVKTFFGQESAENFKNSFEKNGGKITDIEYYTTTQIDAKALVLKAISENPDAVFVTGYGQGYITIINTLRELRYGGVILADSGVTNPEFVDSMKLFDGIIFFKQPPLQSNKSETSKHFQEEYFARFKEKPSDFAAFGYSSMILLGEAIKNSDLSPSGINASLNKISSFDTVLGKLRLYSDGSCSLPFMIGKMKSDGTYDIMETKE